LLQSTRIFVFSQSDIVPFREVKETSINRNLAILKMDVGNVPNKFLERKLNRPKSDNNESDDGIVPVNMSPRYILSRVTNCERNSGIVPVIRLYG
jgi:hypothetical protein